MPKCAFDGCELDGRLYYLAVPTYKRYFCVEHYDLMVAHYKQDNTDHARWMRELNDW